jgi:hypothetical protein
LDIIQIKCVGHYPDLPGTVYWCHSCRWKMSSRHVSKLNILNVSIGWRHISLFSTDTSSFAKEVKRAQVSGNLDAPEGGFDAIMQVFRE